jgi:hypothetical protein
MSAIGFQSTFDTNQARLNRAKTSRKRTLAATVTTNDENWFADSSLDRDRSTRISSDSGPKRAPKTPRAEKVRRLLASLREVDFSPIDLVLEVLDSGKLDYVSYRTALYK